jgi:hypothetical protein
MFEISSALQSQLFSHSVTWQLLTDKGQVAGPLAPCRQELRVEVWPKVVYVHLQKNILRCDCPWGVSTFISYKKYLEVAIARAFSKALSLEVYQKSYDRYTVTSARDPHKQYEITLHSDQISCTCDRYRCLNNRIWSEAPYLHSLIKTNKVLRGQIPCHHVVAVLKSFNFTNFKDYFTEWPNIQSQIVKEARDSLFS